MIQATVHLSGSKIIGQFWANSKPISKPIVFPNRDTAEAYMARAFKRDIMQIQGCWIGQGRQSTLYLTRLEETDA
jgi:hypothetical protein